MNRRNYRSSSRKNCSKLLCDILEDRITPIVWGAGGSIGTPSLIPGDGNFEAFSGVVQLTIPTSTGIKYGSGSLVQSSENTGYGSYILTAAHVPDQLVQIPVTVGFDLPNRDKTNLTPFRISLTVPAGAAYQSVDPLYATQKSDANLAILKLVDQELTTQNPTRLLVPPRGSLTYTPYTSGYYLPPIEINKPVTVVGYGLVSDGTTPIIGFGLPWQNAPLLAGKKSFARNKVELATWGNATSLFPAYNYVRILAIDFDDGTAVHDAFGVHELKPDVGGDYERLPTRADSGGPWFQVINGQSYIVGVESTATRYPDSSTQTDITANIDSTFGEVDLATRVGINYSRFIQPNTTPGKYDLVLDMNSQMYGLSNAPGCDLAGARNFKGFWLAEDRFHRESVTESSES